MASSCACVRRHRRQAAMMLWSCVLLVCAACARPSAQAPGTPSTTASATDPAAAVAVLPPGPSPPTPVLSGEGPSPDRPAGAPGRPAPTTAEIYASFTPSARHSVVVPDAADAAAWTPHRIHRYRGRDALPSLQALSPVLTGARPLSVLPAAVRVQTEPNALVAAWADQLGSFSTGQRGIVVRADATGVAVIDVKTGVDNGSYPIFVTSPSRSGLLVFSIGVQ